MLMLAEAPTDGVGWISGLVEAVESVLKEDREEEELAYTEFALRRVEDCALLSECPRVASYSARSKSRSTVSISRRDIDSEPVKPFRNFAHQLSRPRG